MLREVFDYDYSEVSRIVEKSEANCRQILRRAHQHIVVRRPRFDVSPQHGAEMASQFLQVCADGDMEGLLGMLADDITLWADGGGKVVAATRPIFGADKVTQFIVGALRKLVPPTLVTHFVTVNGQPGFINYVDGLPQSVLTLDILDGKIQGIYIVTNPDKLESLPVLSPEIQI